MTLTEKVDTRKKLVKVIARFTNLAEQSVEPDTTFEDMNIDSIDCVELIMKVEEEFNIQIPTDDTNKFTSVAELNEYVVALLSAKETLESSATGYFEQLEETLLIFARVYARVKHYGSPTDDVPVVASLDSHEWELLAENVDFGAKEDKPLLIEHFKQAYELLKDRRKI